MPNFHLQAQVEDAKLGQATHHMIRIPDPMVTALGGHNARVILRIRDLCINRALRSAPGGTGHCVWIGRDLLTQIGAQAGTSLDVHLQTA